MRINLYQGNNLDSLDQLAENSVDAIVTDPPYGLEFMGKQWDYDVPTKEFWERALRVLKPGAHVLSFSGTRTYHRMVVNMEDAGLEIRDQLQWLYGSGFPKNHGVAKNIDKKFGARKKTGRTIKSSGMNKVQIKQGQQNYSKLEFDEYDSEPVTPEAKHWQGWGTALKPACEPIVLARKPFDSDVATNVLKRGVGAINIDGCRAGERYPSNVIVDEEVSEQLPRFFYTAKASKAEKNFAVGENHHPTVKPTDLMRYLIRLITPQNGVVLDPFMGSGSTGVAAVLERASFIGMELDPEYFKIAETRIGKLKQAVSINTEVKKKEMEKEKAKIMARMRRWKKERTEVEL